MLRQGYENNSPPSELLFYTNYDNVSNTDSPVPPWQAEQEPRAVDPATNRITVIASHNVPGTGVFKPSSNVMRVELRPYSATNPGSSTPADGDVQNSSGYLANRAEMYARHAVPGSTPPDGWPDPPGSVRWIGFSLLIPADFEFTPEGTNYWLTLTQFKGFRGGSPPIAIEIKRRTVIIGGKHGHLVGSGGFLGNATPGVWCRVVVGIRYSPDPATGWVEGYFNDTNVATRTNVATMDVINNAPDPLYIKQGIYRTGEWATTNVLYFGPLKMGMTYSDVAH